MSFYERMRRSTIPPFMLISAISAVRRKEFGWDGFFALKDAEPLKNQLISRRKFDGCGS